MRRRCQSCGDEYTHDAVVADGPFQGEHVSPLVVTCSYDCLVAEIAERSLLMRPIHLQGR